MQVVWFKRDLRVVDHRPLVQAIAAGPVCCLYIYEPDLLAGPHVDRSQLNFTNQCLTALADDLAARGGQLVTRVGSATSVLNELHHQLPITHIWSHEETGLLDSYSRDQAVAAWCRQHQVTWTELPQHGVVRRLRDRDGWSRRWATTMAAAPLPAPDAVPSVPGLHTDGIRAAEELIQRPSSVRSDQIGGTAHAAAILDDFLAQRGQRYQTEMSSPVTAGEACSRISPYLAYGAISMRMVHHATEQARAGIKGERSDDAKDWRKSYASFAKRLRWHCHFMQKLEDQPDLEQHSIHRGYDGLRENDFCPTRFDAWTKGETGYPMVDACMRAVAATGWLNFRMRAMVVSFASYHLWLDWRPTGQWLGRHFLDFEPGIHYSQFQMQSGVTGINTLRIYSPTKQVADHDPTGVFIRQWVPELAEIPDEFLAEPWSMPPLLQQSYGLTIGEQYPLPLVDHKEAVALARQRITERRRQPEVRTEAAEVVKKHGSRRRPTRRKTAPKQA